MTEDDLMLLINDYAAAYNRTNSKINQAAAREILAAIQAYGDERMARAEAQAHYRERCRTGAWLPR